MQRIFEQFQEQPDTHLIAVIPVAGVAKGEHETLFITSIERYVDESRVRGALVLGPEHPEHEWRNRGRPGHPFFMVTMDDDVGTEYISMPDSGGGGMHRFDFSLRVKPGMPENVQSITLSISAPEWDTEATRLFFTEGTRLPARWKLTIDPSTGTGPIQAQHASRTGEYQETE